MEDDEDFEELFSFAAATPPQPTGKASPSTSSEFDMITNNSNSDDSATGDNARTTSSSEMMPPTPGSTTSDFDDLFGTPPPLDPAKKMSSFGAEATKQEEDPETSFLGSDALDDFQVHDEGTRDFLDWLDDDAGKKDPSKGAENDIASSNDKSDGGGEKNKDDDDDFDFDAMLSDVAIDDTKAKQAAPAVSTSAAAAKPGPTPVTKEKTAPKKQVVQVKPPQHQQQKQIIEPKGTQTTEQKPAPSPPTIPPKQQVDSPPAEVIDSNAASIAETTAKDNDDIAAPLEDAANDFVMESSDEVEGNTLDVVMTDEPSSETTTEPEIETNETNAVDQAQLQARPSVEDELSYQQWSDDVEEDNVENADDNKAYKENTAGDEAAVEKKPVFSSLSEAIRSNSSTIEDVRLLFSREIGTDGIRTISPEDRAHLWAKVICGKTLEDVDNSSLADSFRDWQKNHNNASDADKESTMFDALLLKASSIDNTNELYEAAKEQLVSVLNFHSQGKGSSAKTDTLLPPVAHAILQTGMPLAVASVVLSQIEPRAMPLMRLSTKERFLAAKALHADFYLLACYHLPLLMIHLDRNCQDWYWPKKEEEETPDDKDATSNDINETKEDGAESVNENAKSKRGENNGLIPQSWFVTNFAGECDDGLDHANLLPLWDNIMTKGDSSWKFFLAISVLEKRSDVLLMLTGDELRKELEELFHFSETPVESFIGSADDSGDGMVPEWLSMSKSLIECTPSSVIELLRSADDRAVANAIKLRQIQMEKELQAQADAHEAALKKEREERDAEEKKAEIKARLTAYYRTHNPEKLDTIDQILKLFDGRIGVLDEKLKKKYGSGFLPESAPIHQVSNQTRSFFMSVNQSINDTKKHIAASVKERRKKSARDDTNLKTHVSVALEVSPTEVIPHICSKKQAVGDRSTRLPNDDGTLNFYLIDCRPESIAGEQGRFPKAINMSPEKLQDPEELQRLIDMFESLRGAVHICVMGEGFASFPVLYNHPLSKEEQKLLEDDISRTSSCALFFLKKGFPFVSLLRGGFAAAHAFLSRSGPPGLSPTEVLVDYDPDLSLFAQLEATRQEQERFKSASNREKTARAVQRIIDNSMTRLTLAEMRINSSAAGLSNPENVVKVKQSVVGLKKQIPSVSFGRTPPLFMSKKLAHVEEGNKEKSATMNEDSKAEDKKDEKTTFRLPSLKSDASSETDLNQTKADSSAATPISTTEQHGDSQETKNEGKSATTIGTSKETEAAESKLPKFQLESAKQSLSSFANRIIVADSKGKPAEAPATSTKEEGPSKISASFSSFAAKMKTPATTGSKAADDTEKGSTDKTTATSPKEEGTSKISASFSSFAAKMKAPATASVSGSKTADDADKASVAETTATSPKEEGPSKISASFSSFAAKMKTSAAVAGTGSKVVDDAEKASVAETTATSPKEEGPSKISASFSSFAAKMKTSTAAGTGNTAEDDAEKAPTSSMTTSLSSFANKMKSSANNITGKAADNEETDKKPPSNPFSSFSLKKTTTPDWMAPKAEKSSSEATSPVSEKLGWLMKDKSAGKEDQKKQTTESSETTEDESLVFDVEEEINFD